MPLREWFLVLRAAALLWFVNFGLRYLEYSKFRKMLRVDEKHVPQRQVQPTEFDSIKRLHYLVGAATHLCPWESKCLARSSVLNRMLTGGGVPSVVCFGASHELGDFEAHAWVEVNGLPICESRFNREKYEPFDHASMSADNG